MASLAMDHCRKLPAKIKRITNTHVHTIATCWDILMYSISREQDTTMRTGILPRNTYVRAPHRTHQDLIDLDRIWPMGAAKYTSNSFFGRNGILGNVDIQLNE